MTTLQIPNKMRPSISFLSKKGFSLVEVMVASGIAGIMFLFINHTINNLNQSQKMLERRVSVTEIKQDISNLLSDSKNCRTSFYHLTMPDPDDFNSTNNNLVSLDDLKYLILLEPQIPFMFSLDDFLVNYYTWEDLTVDKKLKTAHDKYKYDHMVPPSGVTPTPASQRVHLFRQYAISNKLPSKVRPLTYSLKKSNVDYYENGLSTNKLTLLIQFALTNSDTANIKPARIPLYFQVNSSNKIEQCSTKIPF